MELCKKRLKTGRACLGSGLSPVQSNISFSDSQQGGVCSSGRLSRFSGSYPGPRVYVLLFEEHACQT